MTTGEEFFRRILPLTLAVWAVGVIVSYLQHGFLIGGARGVPLAGADSTVAIWHLLLLGFIAGYSMALVGGATGLISLPYDMSVLGFTTIHVSPTVQLETFLNPLGALIGFRRSGQWNGDFALPLCAGAAAGALIGPFVRVHWLSDPVPFKAVVGVALIFVACQMLYRICNGRTKAVSIPIGGINGGDTATVRKPTMGIHTIEKSWSHLRLAYGEEQCRMSMPGLTALGCGVGVIGTTLGVGGGFLLVPILAEFHRLPMRVIVAGSIPYVIVLSAVGLFSFNVSVPLLTGRHVSPEWAWGFFTGGAAILGSWYATHSQRHIPEGILRGILGVSIGAVGLLYVLGFLGIAPIKI